MPITVHEEFPILTKNFLTQVCLWEIEMTRMIIHSLPTYVQSIAIERFLGWWIRFAKPPFASGGCSQPKLKSSGSTTDSLINEEWTHRRDWPFYED